MSIKLIATPSLKQQKKAFTQYPKLLLNDINKGMSEMVRVTRDYARKRIKLGTRTGRTYTIFGRKHIASRGGEGGEYPKGITHKLERSIRVNTGRRFDKDIGSNLDYADFLQTGTSNMKARKWLDRAWDESEGKHKKIIGKIMAGRSIGITRRSI